jgi:GNAT superfamily N-acetyltransferase
VSVDVQRITVDDLDLALAAELAAIDNAALEQTVRRRHTAETLLLECRDYGTEGPLEGLWLARQDGRVVGYAGLTLNAFENLDGAKILGAVHPDHQRHGIGGTLMEAAERGTDRPRLRAPAWAGTAGEEAVPRMGYPDGDLIRYAVSRCATHSPPNSWPGPTAPPRRTTWTASWARTPRTC